MAAAAMATAQREFDAEPGRIARQLNDNRVLCRSGVDRERNLHRKGDGWTVQSVAAILANPRYTGRQVWNRQRRPRPRGSTPEDLASRLRSAQLILTTNGINWSIEPAEECH